MDFMLACDQETSLRMESTIHDELMAICVEYQGRNHRILEFPLIARMQDYYGDAVWQPSEIDPLIQQIDAMRDREELGPDSRRFLEEFRLIAGRAANETSELRAYVD